MEWISERPQLQNIPDNEIVKRAIEVALAGEHNLFIVFYPGSPGLQLAIATNGIAAELGLHMKCTAVQSCVCGYYGSPESQCRCNAKSLIRHYRNIFEEANECDILIEATTPYSTRIGESESNIIARIKGSRKRTVDTSIISYSCQSMIDLYIADFDNSRLPNIERVAATIAKLEAASGVEIQHTCEAIQYQMLWHQLPFQASCST